MSAGYAARVEGSVSGGLPADIRKWVNFLERALMPVMAFTRFGRFFREAGEVRVHRDDIKRCLDFVNDSLP